jgi:transglutaminase-like putative cysteine protease
MNLVARRTLRLRFRDLAALSAFVAVALSGTVPLWVIAVFAGGWVGSMAGWRPLAKRPVVTVILLLVTAVLLFGAAFRGLIDLVVAAVSFALLVTTQRMLSAPGAATDQQVLLASLLLMAGAAALSGEIWYAVSLLFFGVFACLSLGLSVIEGPEERDQELPVRPVMTQLMIGVGVALMGGLAFFILFPRLSWNMAARRTPPGVLGGSAGMSDRVRLGGGGTLKTSARVVLRAKIEPNPSDDQLDRYWVGRYFDDFNGREWKGSGVEQPARPRVQVGTSTGRFTVQRIELLPAYDSRTLVGLDAPLVFDGATVLTATGQSNATLIEVKGEEVRFANAGNAYSYTVASRTPDGVGEKETPDPKYVALPKLDPRIAALAQQVVGTETDPLRMGRKLEAYLRSNYQYSLALPGELDDPLADFLFVRKEGHCEHFATALAVLLRTRGVSARVTAGFFGGERVNESYVVRAGDAHAWVQAFIPGKGWVSMDATPDSGRRNNSSVLLAAITTWYEKIEQLWQTRVVDYSIQDQVQLVRSLVKQPDEVERSTFSLSRIPKKALLAGVLTSILVLLLVRYAFRPRAKRPHPLASFLDDIELRLERAHIAKLPGEGLEELSARLTHTAHPLAAPLTAASKRYLEARFGTRGLSRAERSALLAALTTARVREPATGPAN